MPIVTLRDLYVAELYDLYDAEQQVLQELSGMAARATSADLRQLFERHYEETQVHLERLELLLRQLNDRSPQRGGEGMRGLIQETRRRAGAAERGEVLDAVLIAAAQRIEHHEIAAYGCVRTYAQTLGDVEAMRLLQQTLDEEGAADRMLTRIAQHGINQAAGEDLVASPTTYRSRLRYAGATDLEDPSYRGYALENDDSDELGHLDGFIIDEGSGRPVYVVVDSGGWFAGRRYVLPVGQLRADHHARRLRTTLSREQLRRYPEFSPSAFVAMADEEVRRYARRLAGAGFPSQAPGRAPLDEPVYEGPLYETSDWLLSGKRSADPAPAAPARLPLKEKPQRTPRRIRSTGPVIEADGRARTAELAEAADAKPRVPPASRQVETTGAESAVDAGRIEKYPER